MAGLDFYRKAVKYQSLFAPPGQIVENSLQTNGILVDEEWARFLARHKFLVGVSLDGPKELHDYYRKDHAGSPSYQWVMRGIEWLRCCNVDFNILTLLNRRNIEHPREIYQGFLKEGFRYLQFIPCVEKLQETGEIAEYSITPEQYGRFLCEVFDEWIGGGVPQVYVRDFDEILITYVTDEAPSCTFSRECGNYVVVEYNGDVYACDFYVEPKWFLGNLTEQPLEEIIAGEKFLGFKKQKSKLTRKCSGCPWLIHCRGGCPKHWAVLKSESNYFCPSYQMFFEHCHSGFLKLKRFVQQKGANAFRR